MGNVIATFMSRRPVRWCHKWTVCLAYQYTICRHLALHRKLRDYWNARISTHSRKLSDLSKNFSKKNLHKNFALLCISVASVSHTEESAQILQVNQSINPSSNSFRHFNIRYYLQSAWSRTTTFFFFLVRCRKAGQKSVPGRSCDRPSRLRFFLVSLGPWANAGMVPDSSKLPQHVSHIALPT